MPKIAGYYWSRDAHLTQVVPIDIEFSGTGPVVVFFMDGYFAEPETITGEFWTKPLRSPAS